MYLYLKVTYREYAFTILPATTLVNFFHSKGLAEHGAPIKIASSMIPSQPSCSDISCVQNNYVYWVARNYNPSENDLSYTHPYLSLKKCANSFTHAHKHDPPPHTQKIICTRCFRRFLLNFAGVFLM